MPRTSKYSTPEQLAQSKREAKARWRAKHADRWKQIQRESYRRRVQRRKALQAASTKEVEK